MSGCGKPVLAAGGTARPTSTRWPPRSFCNPFSTPTAMPKLDAEVLFHALAESMRPFVTKDTALVGIHTGGVWLAQRLHVSLMLLAPIPALHCATFPFGSMYTGAYYYFAVNM